MENNKVTIGIPVYNGERYIGESLASIVQQTRPVDEIIISDNHSTDQTPEILKQFVKDNPDLNIRINRNDETISLSHNFNKCIELCTGDYLILLGADDRLKPDTVEKHLDVFNKYPDLALVGGLFDTINQNGKVTNVAPKNGVVIFEKGDLLKFMEYTSFYMQHSTIMLNMKYTSQVGYYDPEIIAPDERFNVEHLLRFPIAQIREGIIESRIHEDQATKEERLRFEDKILHFQANLEMAKFETTPQRQKALDKLLKKWIAAQSMSISNTLKRKLNNKELASKYWYYGLKMDPNRYFQVYVTNRFKRLFKLKGSKKVNPNKEGVRVPGRG
jgi:glycosyltransferase involved in cell wall biosynthesis